MNMNRTNPKGKEGNVGKKKYSNNVFETLLKLSFSLPALYFIVIKLGAPARHSPRLHRQLKRSTLNAWHTSPMLHLHLHLSPCPRSLLRTLFVSITSRPRPLPLSPPSPSLSAHRALSLGIAMNRYIGK